MPALNTNRLLKEIGHDVKNKLSVIGSTINDLKSGFAIDQESLSDSITALNYLLNFANILTQSTLLTQSNDDNPENKLFSYLASTIEPILKNLAQENLSSDVIEVMILIKSGKLSFDKTIKIPIAKNPKQSFEFINKPKTSSEVSYGLLIKSQMSLFNLKTLELSLLDQKSGAEIANVIIES